MVRTKILFWDPRREYRILSRSLSQASRSVFASGRYILGPHLERFEHAFARFSSAPFGCGVASGTEAIALALMACGVGPGDEVITVANTATPTVVGILQTGATPVLVDIDPGTWLMAPKNIAPNVTKRTRAIIPVHLYGHLAPMEEIMKISRDFGLDIIEDACQAHGAKLSGRCAGTLGRFGAFSFYPTKNLGAYGDGGMILVKDKSDEEKIKRLRNYGQIDRYRHESLGLNSRLDDMQAAWLSCKLKYLKKNNRKRKILAQIYRGAFEKIPGIKLPQILPKSDPAYHLMVMRVKERDRLREYLQNHGIETLIHYPNPVHKQKAFRAFSWSGRSLPVTENLACEILSLPLYPDLATSEVRAVIKTVKSFYS